MFDHINSIRSKIREIYGLMSSANKSLGDYGDGVVTDGGNVLTSDDIDKKFQDIDKELSDLSLIKDPNKLRIVRVFRYKKTNNDEKPWRRVFLGQGVLHDWGFGYSEFEGILKHFSSAIVEMPDGVVKNVQVDRIEFVDPLLKKEVKPELSEDEKDGIKKWAGTNTL